MAQLYKEVASQLPNALVAAFNNNDHSPVNQCKEFVIKTLHAAFEEAPDASIVQDGLKEIEYKWLSAQQELERLDTVISRHQDTTSNNRKTGAFGFALENWHGGGPSGRLEDEISQARVEEFDLDQMMDFAA